MTMKWLRIGLMSRLVVDLLYITLHSSSARVATLTLRSVSRACLRSASEPAACMPALDPGRLRRPRARSC